MAVSAACQTAVLLLINISGRTPRPWKHIHKKKISRGNIEATSLTADEVDAIWIQTRKWKCCFLVLKLIKSALNWKQWFWSYSDERTAKCRHEQSGLWCRQIELWLSWSCCWKITCKLKMWKHYLCCACLHWTSSRGLYYEAGFHLIQLTSVLNLGFLYCKRGSLLTRVSCHGNLFRYESLSADQSILQEIVSTFLNCI